MRISNEEQAKLHELKTQFEAHHKPAPQGEDANFKWIDAAPFIRYLEGLAQLSSELSADLVNLVVERDLTLSCVPNLHFQSLVFRGRVSCSGTLFNEVTFSHCQFLDGADFEGAVFRGPVSFIGGSWRGPISFDKVQLQGNASFKDIAFSSGRDDTKLRFCLAVCCDKFAFSVLGNVTVPVSFCGTKFESTATFGQMVSSRCDFSDAVFAQPASFSGAYVGATILDRAVFKADLTMLSMEFKDRLSLRSAKISGLADFSGTKFQNRTDFSQAWFSRAPFFYGSAFSPNTAFHGATFGSSFGVRSWLFGRIARTFLGHSTVKTLAEYRELAAQNNGAYRHLKGICRDINAQEMENLFFSLELRSSRQATRIGDAPFLVLFSLLYDSISGFGQSIGRATFWFFSWNILFFFVYEFSQKVSLGNAISVRSIGSDSAQPFLATHPTIGLTLQNSLNPLASVGDKSLFFVTEGHTCLFAGSLLQGIGALGILALLLLAIRKQFHKGNQ